MTKGDWLDLTVLERKKYNLLSEVADLSQQMGQAMDRNDDVSVRMLVSMRQDPLLQLQELQQVIGNKEAGLPPEDRERLSELRKGEPPQGEGESAFHAQAGSARRLLVRILELDERLNRRMAGESSIYAQNE